MKNTFIKLQISLGLNIVENGLMHVHNSSEYKYKSVVFMGHYEAEMVPIYYLQLAACEVSPNSAHCQSCSSHTKMRIILAALNLFSRIAVV